MTTLVIPNWFLWLVTIYFVIDCGLKIYEIHQQRELRKAEAALQAIQKPSSDSRNDG